FNVKTFVDALAMLLQFQVGVMVIAYFIGPAAVALFSRPRALIQISTRFVMGFARVLVPAASALGEQRDHRRLGELLLRSTKTGVYLSLVPGFVLLILGTPLLRVWMGNKYADTFVLTVMVLGYLPLFAQQTTYHILMGLASHGRVGVASLTASIIGAVLTLL